jgi:hypothetical protein
MLQAELAVETLAAVAAAVAGPMALVNLVVLALLYYVLQENTNIHLILQM